MLVVGSSVMVYSAFSLVERAKAAGARVAVINIGPTRADRLADLKVRPGSRPSPPFRCTPEAGWLLLLRWPRAHARHACRLPHPTPCSPGPALSLSMAGGGTRR